MNNPQQTAHQHKLAHLHYQLGVDALSKNMLPKAFKELMESDSIHPDQPEVLDALAYAWLLRGDYRASEKHYLRAIKTGAGAATSNNYANLLNKLERYTEAANAAQTALNDPRYPNQDLAFINLGNALLGQHQTDRAISTFKQAIIFNPDNDMAKLRLADAHAAAGNNQLADVMYQAILQRRGNSRAAANGLVNSLLQQHRSSAANTALNTFISQTTSEADRAWAIRRLGETR